jgi:hypothetical protein
MAEPTTGGVFSTTLLLLYFITPAANVPAGETKDVQEKKAIWTFQSASQIELSDPDICTSTALQMMDEIRPVRTMTVRAYCLCPNGIEYQGNKECFNEEEFNRHIAQKRLGEFVRPVVKPIGPKTPDPFAPPGKGGAKKCTAHELTKDLGYS